MRNHLSARLLLLLLLPACPMQSPADDAKPDDAALKKLILYVDDEDAAVRLKAVKSLAQLGPAAASALPVLRRHLNDPDPQVRAQVPKAITAISRPPVSPAVQGLIKELNDPDAKTRKAALEALGGLGARAQAALEPIRKLTSDPNPDIRITALKAVVYIESEIDQEKKNQPLKAVDLVGTYVGAPFTDDAIAAAVWKKQIPLAVPGTFKFEVQPAAPSREKVRQILEGARWAINKDGDISVQMTLPAGWEKGFAQNRQLKMSGVLKVDQSKFGTDQLGFGIEHRGTGIASQLFLIGTLARDPQAQLSLEVQITLLGENFLDGKIHQILELQPEKPANP